MVTPGEAIAQLRSGQLKALGVMSEERIQYIPDVPTLKEQGIDVVTGTWRGIGAPKDTPDAVIEKLGLHLMKQWQVKSSKLSWRKVQ